jgi:hypothetical protein
MNEKYVHITCSIVIRLFRCLQANIKKNLKQEAIVEALSKQRRNDAGLRRSLFRLTSSRHRLWLGETSEITMHGKKN